MSPDDDTAIALPAWQCLVTDKAVHVFPLHDLFVHTRSASCPCRPLIEWEHTGDKPMISHHAWDGRPCSLPVPPAN